MNLSRVTVVLLGLTTSVQAIAQAPGEAALVEHRLRGLRVPAIT